MIRVCREIWDSVNAERVPENRRLIYDEAALDGLLRLWFEAAEKELRREKWVSPGDDLTPYTLLSWMTLMKRETKEVEFLANEFIRDDPERLEIYLSGMTDRHFEHFPPDPNLRALPEVEKVVALMEQSSTLPKTHSVLLAALKSHLKKLNQLLGATGGV